MNKVYFSIKQKVLVVKLEIITDIVLPRKEVEMDQLDPKQIGANSYVSSSSCRLVEHDFRIAIESLSSKSSGYEDKRGRPVFYS